MSVYLLPAADLLEDRDLRAGPIVDARRRRSFAGGHIPGAVRMGWEDWCEPAPPAAGSVLAQPGYWGLLADREPAWYADRLATFGLFHESPIVVYADGPPSRGREGRIAWMLLYLGAREIFLLDGGWDAWVAAGGPVEVETPTPERGRFDVSLQPQRRVTLRTLHSALTAGRLPPLVDTRSLPEFRGKVDAYLPRRGRLPGAALAPFAGLFEESGRYAGSAGFPPRAPGTVAYCEVGVRAALFALLHEVRTGQIIPVYDGSLMEWSLQPGLPLEEG